MENPKRLLTEKQFAERASVDPRTIRKLIDQGRLDAEDFGTGKHRHYRIAEDAKVRPLTTPAASVPVVTSRRRHLVSSGPVSFLG